MTDKVDIKSGACTLCQTRNGKPAPKFDDCRCPEQIHTNMMCFVTKKVTP